MPDCGAYIGATGERQATAPMVVAAYTHRELRRFHKAEPFLKLMSRFRSPRQA